ELGILPGRAVVADEPAFGHRRLATHELDRPGRCDGGEHLELPACEPVAAGFQDRALERRWKERELAVLVAGQQSALGAGDEDRAVGQAVDGVEVGELTAAPE